MPAVGAVGAVKGNRDKRKRISAAAAKKEADNQKARDAEMLDFVKSYNPSGKGLTREDLKKVLEDASRQNGKEDVLPTDDEVKFILRTVDKKKNDLVDPEEVDEALMVWGSYLLMRPSINETFDKFDTDHSGKLDKDQLRNFMQSEYEKYLGESGEVTDEDVNWLLSKADVVGDQQIGRIEWLFCNTVWTRELVTRVNKRASVMGAGTAELKSKSSACCVL
jgi:Ca2+-binding EF-hand superfamily protein